MSTKWCLRNDEYIILKKKNGEKKGLIFLDNISISTSTNKTLVVINVSNVTAVPPKKDRSPRACDWQISPVEAQSRIDHKHCLVEQR